MASPCLFQLSYKTRGLLLSLSPILAVICWYCSVTLLWSLAPLAISVLADVLEIQHFRRDMSVPYNVPPNTSARHGRERLQKIMPTKTGRRYLVVGIGGVGRRMIELLMQRGEAHVYGFDLQEFDRIPENKRVLNAEHYIQGDVTNLQSCRNAIQQIKPDVVFHTAAVIMYSRRKPSQWPLSYKVNVEGVLNMLEACTDSSVETFILTSSSTAGVTRSHMHSSVHGNEEHFPPVATEKDALSWYTRSKALAEIKALAYCTAHAAKAPAFGIIRPASGIFHHLDNFGFCPAFQDMHAPAIGFEYTRIDWVFNDNVVLGHLLLERQLNAGKCSGETFLITNQEPLLALDLYRRVQAFAPSSFVYWKMSSTFIFILATITEVLTSLGLSVPKDLALLSYTTLDLATVNYTMDDTKAQQLLGYKPAYTVDEAILKTMQDHQETFPDGGLAKAMRAEEDDESHNKKES